MQLLIIKQDKNVHKKGDIVEVRASGSPFTGREPDAFCLVEVEGEPIGEAKKYNQPWKRILDYTVNSHDEATDVYSATVRSTTAHNSLGEITKGEAENFITGWGGHVTSYGVNEVTFSLGIYAALTSHHFWDIPVINLSFSEESYDPASGVHRIRLDYSARDNNPTYVERYLADRQLDIISHQDKVIVYEASRGVVFDKFKEEVSRRTRRKVAARRYHIDPAMVDTIVNNHGGRITVSKQTALNYIKDKQVE